jgi:hypothetical protein
LQLGKLKHPGPLPKAPADGVPGEGRPEPRLAEVEGQETGRSNDELREQIRKIIADELREILKG